MSASTSRASSIKKEAQQETTTTATPERSTESSEEEDVSDTEPLSKVAKKSASKTSSSSKTNVKEEDKEEGDDQDDGDAPKKKRRRKKKIRFSTPKAKTPGRKPKLKEEEPNKSESAEEAAASKEPSPVPVKQQLFVPGKTRLQQYSALQLLIDHFLRIFVRKDPDEFFTYPVTDSIAPDYSSKVDTPMDFCTMRQKLDADQYAKLDVFKRDLEQICVNAELYNEPNTVYFHAARKLRDLINFEFSRDNLVLLSKRLPFVNSIPVELYGSCNTALPNVAIPDRRKTQSERNFESIVADNMSAEELLSRAQEAADDAKHKLATARPANTHLAYLGMNDDGANTLNIVTSEHFLHGRKKQTSQRVATLRDIVGQLKAGNPGIIQKKDPLAKAAIPVTYLDYGPYASFAPHYDSTWATLNKRDSDILLATYGDKSSAAYAYSLRSFVHNSGDSLLSMVDGLLDSLTDGQHSLSMAQLDTQLHKDITNTDPTLPLDYAQLNTLAQEEAHLSAEKSAPAASSTFSQPQPNVQYESTASPIQNAVQQQLDKGAHLLGELLVEQHDRLSDTPPPTLTDAPPPSQSETQIAAQLLDNFKQIIPQSRPSDVVCSESVHAAMGIDMDVLREFLT